MWSIQVKHSGELGRKDREREWEVADWGERERKEMLRENGVGFRSRSTLVDFDRWSYSTQSIFGYRKWPYRHKDILRHGKQSNRHRGYFWKDICLQRLFWRYIFGSNNTGLHHKCYKTLSLPLGWILDACLILQCYQCFLRRTNPAFQNHLSMMAVPKLLKCFDCDTTICRNEYQCDCAPDPGIHFGREPLLKGEGSIQLTSLF
jgi:hypothetical protein